MGVGWDTSKALKNPQLTTFETIGVPLELSSDPRFGHEDRLGALGTTDHITVSGNLHEGISLHHISQLLLFQGF